MSRLIAPLLLLLLPTLVTAKTYGTRSGEHADFSRIVIAFDEVPEWTLGRVDGGYELRPAEPSAEYNLQRIFQLMPRDRVKEVTERSNGRLFFSVDCNCHVDAFEIRQGLVIDFKDGSGGSRTRFESILPDFENDPPRQIAPTVEPPTPEPVLSTDLTQDFTRDRTDLAWRDSLAVEFKATHPDGPANGDALPITVKPDALSDRVSEVQEALVEQLGRAALQGLVTVDLSETEARIEKTHPAAPDAPHSMGKPDEPDIAEMLEALTGPNVRIETAVDRGNRPKPDHPAMTSGGTDCLPSADFDIANWGTEPSGGAPMPLARPSILGEFDAPDPDSVVALAKHYIYLTFGAEAKALLTAFEAETGNRDHLIAIADIMDFGNARSHPFSRNQVACDTNVAMWAVLSTPRLSPGDDISEQAVLSAFAELPLHLRRHLGRFLAERFLQIGDLDTASSVRDAIARAPGHHGDGFDMMNAQISLEEGETEHAIKQLDEIAAADGPLAPEAIVHRVDSTLDAGHELPHEMTETAAAMAFEAKGTELGEELSRAHLRALAHEGKILEALDAIPKALSAGDITDKVAADLRAEIYDLAADVASDATFLQTALNAPLVLDQGDKAKDIRRRFASRMIDLGLGTRARAILSQIEGVPGPDIRKLYARSYLQDQRPELAIGYLAGLTDAESVKLRGDSHALAGEYDRAAEVFAQTEDSEAMARAVWRGQDWQQAVETGTEPERAAAKLVLEPETTEAETGGPLAMNRDLLARSQEARDRLAKLLAATAKP